MVRANHRPVSLSVGEEYSDVYDENANLIPQRLDIPDWDPTVALNRRRAPVAPAVWPAVRCLAPLRLVVSREPVHGEDGRILYHNEQLQCGHVEFFGANPGKQRRRCKKCL